MSEQTETATPETPVIDYYKSLDVAHREHESQLLTLAMSDGIVPVQLRYGLFRKAWRGALRTIDGAAFYFHWPENGAIHFVKADTTEKLQEATRILKSCTLGCDLRKSDDHDDEEDDDDEKKAAPAGSTADLPPASRTEAEAMQQDNAHLTDDHPGATVADTPDSQESHDRWHGNDGHIERALPELDHTTNANAWSTPDLLKAWGQQLQAMAPRPHHVDPNEQRFMTEVLGATPEQAASGQVRLNSGQRAQFNQWLTRSLRTRLSGLQGWLEKAKR